MAINPEREIQLIIIQAKLGEIVDLLAKFPKDDLLATTMLTMLIEMFATMAKIDGIDLQDRH